jgi:hypothetical protein
MNSIASNLPMVIMLLLLLSVMTVDAQGGSLRSSSTVKPTRKPTKTKKPSSTKPISIISPSSKPTTVEGDLSSITSSPTLRPTSSPTSLCCSTSGICSNGTNGCESSTSGPTCYKKSFGSPIFACGCSATAPVGANGCSTTEPYCVTVDNLIGKGCEVCIFGTSTGCNANQTCGFFPGIEGGRLQCNDNSVSTLFN